MIIDILQSVALVCIGLAVIKCYLILKNLKKIERMRKNRGK